MQNWSPIKNLRTQQQAVRPLDREKRTANELASFAAPADAVLILLVLQRTLRACSSKRELIGLQTATGRCCHGQPLCTRPHSNLCLGKAQRASSDLYISGQKASPRLPDEQSADARCAHRRGRVKCATITGSALIKITVFRK